MEISSYDLESMLSRNLFLFDLYVLVGFVVSILPEGKGIEIRSLNKGQFQRTFDREHNCSGIITGTSYVR
jgi:hypothetical protein